MAYTEFERNIFNRSELLLGWESMDKLQAARVIVFGVGGVGSWCTEALLRAGIRHITIVDSDNVSASNLNRQLMATSETIGRVKVDALRERLLEIDPDAEITAVCKIYSAGNAAEFNLDSYDYVIDCIDSLKDKITLILNATASRAVFFSAMGAALKLDPTKIRVAEFWNVRGCPLGSMLRKRMRRNGTLPSKHFLCVYDEEVLENKGTDHTAGKEITSFRKASINGSLAHITGIFGFTLAGLVISDIVK